MSYQTGTALMGTSLSLLQVIGIPSSICSTTHDLWDLLSIKLHITVQHAVCSIAFAQTEPLKALPILMLYSFEACNRRQNPHRDKDFPIEKSGIMFLSCWNKWPLFLFLYVGKKLNLIYIYWLLKPYTYLEGFIEFPFKPYNSTGKL